MFVHAIKTTIYLLPKFQIIWFSNLSILSVQDEGYSRNVSCTL